MRILSIETGIRCNQGCLFCYQRDYRLSGRGPRDPDTAALLGKLALGRREGYEGVGFSGGEPTAREDFPYLVARARGMGYRRVALTTNGVRLADDTYRRLLLAAGLDAIGWSIHGATAATHDALTGAPGSFDAALRGLTGALADASQARQRLDVNVFTLVSRRNAHELPELCARLRGLGVRLFILQPIVASRGTLTEAGALALGLDELLAAVRAAVAPAARLDYRVKPFNVPVCLLGADEDGPLPSGFELERHAIRVFRGHERQRPEESRLAAPSGFVRLMACGACELRAACPGLHGTLVPQAALRRVVRAALDQRAPGAEAWLGGLELADTETLADAVAATRAAGAERVVLCTGGTSLLGDGFLGAALAAGPDELRFVLHRREPRSGDLRRATRGNLATVHTALLRLAANPAGGGVLRSVGMLLERSERATQAAELADLVAAGAQAVHLEVAPEDPAPEERLADALRLLMGAMRPHRWARQARCTLDLPAPVDVLPEWQRRAARAVCEVTDVRGRFVHSVLSGPSFGWVVDSLPQVAMPADFHAPARWPTGTLGPLVLEPEEAAPLPRTSQGEG